MLARKSSLNRSSQQLSQTAEFMPIDIPGELFTTALAATVSERDKE